MLPCWTFVIIGLVGVVESQMLHSIDRMTAAIKSQETLADLLQDYLVAEERRLKQLELSVQKLRAASMNKLLSRPELEKQMSHPVRVLRFITEIYADVENVRLSVELSPVTEAMNQTLALLPDHGDYVDAVHAIVRLEEVYKNAADFSRPQGNNTKDVLTADELIEIAKICMEEKNFHSALNTVKRAKELYEEVNDVPNAMLAYDYLAYIMYEQGNTDYALNYTYELLEHYKDKDAHTEIVERLNDNVELYIEDLGGEELASRRSKHLTGPYGNDHAEFYENYNELCRGENVQAPEKDTKPLTCYLYTNNNHPLLILSPAKKEDINTATGLSFFHDVLTDREIELLQQRASAKFEDSQLVPDDDIKEDPSIVLEDEHGYNDAKIRSSNTGWVEDDDDAMVLALSTRISAILDLTINSSEAFQVLSYGIGGFYLPHYDWGEGDDPFEGFDGNRIATWIFYLNDIKKGGATVFPTIGATVWPEKGGAAFWKNLHQNGTGNPLTLHAACPVLEGYKWASNKWFHTVGNELLWPCGLTEDL